MILAFLLTFLAYLYPSSYAQDYCDFDCYQEKLTADLIEKRLMKYLKRDAQMQSFFEITPEALILYDSPLENPEHKKEYVLKFAPRDSEQVATCPCKRENLIGVKIAIDPGHLGGVYSHLEERYIEMVQLDENQTPNTIEFDEGMLSFLTAYYLKLLLEQEGAIVYMTREEIGCGVYEEDFFDWLRKKPHLWSEKMPLSKIFRDHYNQLDLRARAKKINAFKPELSIVIHFNSHHVPTGPSNSILTENNYNMVFIPGAFSKNELQDQDSRYEFLRMVLTDDLERSQSLCQQILAHFTERLNVPVVKEEDGARYLNSVCMKVDEGIYARNLVLTRMVHGPICYGETLIQNNEKECMNLAKKDFVIHGTACSSRIKEVAEAYFQGIKAYLLQ